MIKQPVDPESDLTAHSAYQELFQRLKSDQPADEVPSDYYQPPSQPQLVGKLQHLSRYSQLVLVVTGVPGVGKSSLLKAFYPDVDGSVHACCLRAKDRWGVSDLLNELVEQLELDVRPTASDESKLQAIYAHAELLQDIGRLFLVVVDDSERLSFDALDLLINLLTRTDDPNAAPHLVLFGSPRLNELLDDPRFRHLQSGGGHFIELQPFDYEETVAYLRHRLGAEFDELSPRQLQQIHHSSFGLPGRINKVLDGVQGAQAERGESRRWLTLRFPRLHLWLTVTVLLFMGLGVGLVSVWEAMQGLGQEQEVVALALPSLDEPADKPASVAPVLTLSEKLAREEAKLRAEAPLSGSKSSTAEGSKAGLDVAPLSQSKPPKDAAAEPEAGTLLLAPPPPLVVKQAPVAKVAEAPAERVVVAAPAAPAVRAPDLHPLRRDAELLRWPSSAYTLQVLGARKAESAIEFIQSQRDRQNFYYFSTIYKSKPWHVVVYGRFANRDEAIASVPGLPASLRKLKPWARSVAGVQQDIKRQK